MIFLTNLRHTVTASTDIDLDFFDRTSALSKLPHVQASIYKNGDLTPHNSGVYFQKIPIDPVTGLASLDYKDAEKKGFFKIDFLNSSMYQGIENEQHLDLLMSVEPNWELLSDSTIVQQLPHISDHYDLLQRYPVTSVEDLAVFLALIRRRFTWYKDLTWDQIKDKIWDKISDDDGYYFKRSHSFAYSVAISCILVKIEMDNL